jgi:hypothetical protein
MSKEEVKVTFETGKGVSVFAMQWRIRMKP